MEPKVRSSDAQEPQVTPQQDGGKLVMHGVMTHERILNMIKERNPIIARRDDRRG
jgi:hypothetical protein